MKSFITIATDRETGVVYIKEKLLPDEVHELAVIRHYVVQSITKVLDPERKKITFRWDL